ncbi:hypothetical protein BgiBS90_029063 [Biomphalaria glabrata]|nr:hypothetical protein BgiBS90_029063 [Biomphalaria glabrata]
MRNKLTSLCTLNLNETGSSGNFREFQSNGIRCEKTITKWLETPTFDCDFQEKCENTTEKCYSIVCLRPQNNCTLMSGCNGVFKIQWKQESDYIRTSTLSYACEETVDRKCFVHCYKQESTRPTFSKCNLSYRTTRPTSSKSNSSYRTIRPTFSKSNSPYPSTSPTSSKNNPLYSSTTTTSSTNKLLLTKSVNTTPTLHDDKKDKRDNGKNKKNKLNTETILISVLICLIVITILVILCFLSKSFRQRMGQTCSCFTNTTVSHCSSGDAKSNTTQGNTNVSHSTTNICFDGESHIYNDCSISDAVPSWEICGTSLATNTSKYSDGSKTEQAKLKKSTCENANKDINEPDTTEYNRLRDQTRIAAVDYNCHIPDKSLISPRSSDISELNNSDYTSAKDSQTLGKDTLTTSPYSLVELVEPSNEPNFRFNQTDLAQNILIQQIEMITIF